MQRATPSLRLPEVTATLARCKLRCVRFERPVLFTEIAGYGEVEAALQVIAWIDQQVAAKGPIHVMHDWRGVTGYDTEARELLTAHAKQLGTNLASASILFQSRVVAMGIHVANMMLGGKLLAMGDVERFRKLLVDAGGSDATLKSAA